MLPLVSMIEINKVILTVAWWAVLLNFKSGRKFWQKWKLCPQMFTYRYLWLVYARYLASKKNIPKIWHCWKEHHTYLVHMCLIIDICSLTMTSIRQHKKFCFPGKSIIPCPQMFTYRYLWYDYYQYLAPQNTPKNETELFT